MTSKHTFEGQCLGKFSFPSKSLADSTIRKKHNVASYRCPHCGNWHVGHADGGKKRIKEMPIDDNLDA